MRTIEYRTCSTAQLLDTIRGTTVNRIQLKQVRVVQSARQQGRVWRVE